MGTGAVAGKIGKRAPTNDTPLPLVRALRVRGICLGIRTSMVPIRGPFIHIAVHVEETPWVRRILTDVSGLAKSAA